MNDNTESPANDTHHPGCATWPRLTGRLATRGIRLLRPTRRLRGRTGPRRQTNEVHEVPWQLRERVLRDYHAANLIRARRSAEELVRAGFNTGAVPFGYRAQRVRVSPPGRRPRWRTRLVIDPVEAAAVKMIFMWRVTERASSAEIRRRLTAARYPAPLDPETGQPGAWTRAAVRAILRNPKYTGHQVWGRRHHGRRAPRTQWVWSATWAHPPLITPEEFAAANRHSWSAATPPDAPAGEHGLNASQHHTGPSDETKRAA
jgi:hypothetical protein